MTKQRARGPTSVERLVALGGPVTHWWRGGRWCCRLVERLDTRDDRGDLRMPSYAVNKTAVENARRLIDSRQYVLDSDWGAVQPSAADQNAYLETHSWEDYAGWHLGLTEGAADETKARYAFVIGDLRRIHRTGLIACVYRASEWRHKDVELAAHDLLQRLDSATGLKPNG